MASVVVLACPVCAAPLRPDASRCAYCGSLVVIQTDLPRLDPAQLNRTVVEEHIARFRARVRRDPDDAEAHYGLGLAYFNLGLLDEAADELAQAARLTPENPHIQYQLAVVYDRLTAAGRPAAAASARDRVERALLLRPDYADALVLKGNLQLAARDWPGALRTLRRAADLNAAAASKSLVSFIAAHEEVLARFSPYSGAAERAEHVATITPSRNRLRSIAVGSFVAGLLFALGGAPEAVGWALIVVVPLALMLYRARRWPLETPALRAEWDARDAERRRLLSPLGASATELLGVADALAAHLGRQPPSAQANAVAPRAQAAPQGWETCQIVARRGLLYGPFYEVQASGPGGVRKLKGYGEQRPLSNDRKARRHVAEVGQRLIAEGWEPLPGGVDWWNLRFRRPAR